MLSAAKHPGIFNWREEEENAGILRFASFRMTGGRFYAPTYGVVFNYRRGGGWRLAVQVCAI
jgi:hypothetical protein